MPPRPILRSIATCPGPSPRSNSFKSSELCTCSSADDEAAVKAAIRAIYAALGSCIGSEGTLRSRVSASLFSSGTRSCLMKLVIISRQLVNAQVSCATTAVSVFSAGHARHPTKTQRCHRSKGPIAFQIQRLRGPERASCCPVCKSMALVVLFPRLVSVLASNSGVRSRSLSGLYRSSSWLAG